MSEKFNAVIMAAGRGSRMEERTEDKPKLFLDVGSKTIFERQYQILSEFCEEITVVLGHGFDSSQEAEEIFEDLENVSTVYMEDWDQFENAESCKRGLEKVPSDRHTLLICGDIVFNREFFENFLAKYCEKLSDNGFNAVAAIEGLQDEMTSVKWNEDGEITEYGAIEGHQEAGLFMLNPEYIEDSIEILSENENNWFPVIFEETSSKRVLVERENRHEINTPKHFSEAEEKVKSWD